MRISRDASLSLGPGPVDGHSVASIRRRAVCASVAGMISVLIGVMLPVPADASTVRVRGYVAMFSDADAFVGGGQPHIFRSGDARIQLTGDASVLSVSVSGGIDGGSFELEFAAPTGQRLHAGLYSDVENVVLREPGEAGLNIRGDGRGCDRIGGRFDVKDIRARSDGSVEQLWLTFEQHCENLHPALFGEVKLGFADDDPLLITPGMLWWPDTDLGATASVVPITIFNVGRRAITLRSTRVVGRHVRDFPVRLDECSDRTLGPGDLCQVFIRFRPLAPGPRIAALVVRDSWARSHRTSLDGFGVGGKTQFVFDSDPGDFIGQGGSRRYDSGSATITAVGSPTVVKGEIQGVDASRWSVTFAAPDGTSLAVGKTYDDALRYPFNDAHPGMDISGQGRGCNDIEGTFKVTALSTTPEGSLEFVGVRFEQHCEGSVPALRGAFDFRVPTGDTRATDSVRRLSLRRRGSSATVAWNDPGNRDFAYTVIRLLQSRNVPVAPNSGLFVYAGRRGLARIHGLIRGRPVAVAAFAVDTAGNVSTPTSNVSRD
jgi:hypothetical protein